ncbi:MAG: hypothetical protein Q8Q35_01240 [Nanoarchaeota archaeon]|nr:hypothetical protein [Nanoarchaeota archaeon]
MSYRVIPSNTFLKQISNLDEKSIRIIKEKIELIKENPFRFKKLNSPIFSRVFGVKLNISSNASRLIYVFLEPNVVLVCLLERKKDYKDLDKYLKKLKS